MTAPHRRHGFILLFGTRAIVSNESAVPTVRTRCPNCGQEADLVAKSYRNWFTLFFIPVFPISGRTQLTECTHCRAQFPIRAEELRARVTEADRGQNERAIALYNSLRASPANSVTLNELLALYGSMQEYDQAVSAAAEFPQALQNSEQCMTTLGRIYMQQGRHDEALQWFDAATGRNPGLGEAHYYAALTHLLKTPPEPGKAVVAARAARGAGFPQADALLREAEAKARGV